MVRMVIKCCISLLLFAEALMDLKYKQIWWPLCLAGGVTGVIVNGIILGTPFFYLLTGLLPAIILLPFALKSKSLIGLGDVYIAAACGLLLGAAPCAQLMFLGFLFAGLCSLLLLALGKVKTNSRLPFVPFLLGAWIAFSVV